MEVFVPKFQEIKEIFSNLTLEIGDVYMDVSQLHIPPMPDIDIQCIKSLVIDGEGITRDHFDDKFSLVRKEVYENIKLPIEATKLNDHITEILNFYNSLEAQIILKENNILHADFCKFKDTTQKDLGKMDSDFYQSFLHGLKNRLRNEIAYYTELKKQLPEPHEHNKEGKKNKELHILDFRQISDKRIKSFKWKSTVTFHEDMLKLHFYLTKGRIISEEISPEMISNGFNGKILNKHLNIKWNVQGKNKMTSKSSLFLFLDELMEKGLIEKVDCKKNHKPLYEKIAMIFVDKDGNSFSNLEVSRVESVKSDPVKSDIIKNIIKEMLTHHDKRSNS